MRIEEIKFDRVELTSQGFLVADANLTRSGVFDYHDGNGKTIRELRPSEEVFSKESLDSLKFAPLTKHHPNEMVTADNIKKFQIGMVGENIEKRGDFVHGKIVITDPKEIKDILSKRDKGESIELSMGYDAEVVDVAGDHHKDGSFDKTQRKIRYNHASVVDKGRAGREVKLILDAEREIIDKENKTDNQEEIMKFKKDGVEVGGFRMDSIEGTIHEDAKDVVDRLSKKLDEAIAVIRTQIADAETAGKSTDELQAKFDQLESDSKDVKSKLDELSNPNSETIQSMIKERADLETVAGKLDVKVEKEDGTKKSNKELKIDSIVAVCKDFKAEGKSDDYLGARFDSIVDAINASKDDKTKTSIGSFLKDAKDKSSAEKINPREDFMKKSDAMHKEENK